MGKAQDDKKGAENRKKLMQRVLSLKTILENERYRICTNPEVLAMAIKDLTSPSQSGRTSWRYKLEGLQFECVYEGGSQPISKDLQLKIQLAMTAAGNIENPAHDPFNELAINFIVSTDFKGQVHMDTWHFDRHIVNEDSCEPTDVHPYYHLQRGGKELHHLKNDIGKTLVIEPPRIAQPPLDVVLAVDYLISNYAGYAWRDLQGLTEYRSLVRECQDDLWKPYVVTIHEYFKTPIAGRSIEARKLLPNLA